MAWSPGCTGRSHLHHPPTGDLHEDLDSVPVCCRAFAPCSGQATHYVGDLTRTYQARGYTDLVVTESKTGVTVFASGTALVVDGLFAGSAVFDRGSQPNQWIINPLLSNYESAEGPTENRASTSPDYRYQLALEQGSAEVLPNYATFDLVGTREIEEDGSTAIAKVTFKFSGLKF